MTITRPSHLRSRQIANSMFTENAVLVQTLPGQRNEQGEFVAGTETKTDIKVVSQPISSSASNQMARELEQSGIRLESMRTFFLLDNNIKSIVPETNIGDKIEYKTSAYQVHNVSKWDDFLVEIVGVRIQGFS